MLKKDVYLGGCPIKTMSWYVQGRPQKFAVTFTVTKVMMLLYVFFFCDLQSVIRLTPSTEFKNSEVLSQNQSCFIEKVVRRYLFFSNS